MHDADVSHTHGIIEFVINIRGLMDTFAADAMCDGSTSSGNSKQNAFGHHTTYSPELNPCEMVFGFMSQNSLRVSRNSGNTFFDEVNERFHAISHEGMERIYLHCLRAGAL